MVRVCNHVTPLEASVAMKQLPLYVIRWRKVGRLSKYVWVLSGIGVKQVFERDEFWFFLFLFVKMSVENDSRAILWS